MNYDHIQVNTQSSIRIKGSKVVYFDPFQIGAEAHDADLICITHAHYDHFDPKSILRVCKQDTELAVPASMAGDLEIRGTVITAKPAYNKLKPFHPKRNGWLGYLLEMDGRVYYVAGDTDAVKELQEIRCDAALVPIGGKFTMNAREAAGLVNKIKPKAAIPIHYGSLVGKPQDAETFRKMVDREVQVVLKL